MRISWEFSVFFVIYVVSNNPHYIQNHSKQRDQTLSSDAEYTYAKNEKVSVFYVANKKNYVKAKLLTSAQCLQFFWKKYFVLVNHAMESIHANFRRM